MKIYLWKTFLSDRLPRPTRSGYVQMVNDGDHRGQSSTMFLPMVDMNPDNMTCVNSTLHFVAERYGATPVLQSPAPCKNITYVLDGGALLHRIPWQLGKTYKILQDCTRYVTKHYGQAVVVFDYEVGLSTKDNTHQRRVQCDGDALAKESCEARGDADTLIVLTAVKISGDIETVLVGDDTDLLVLLIHFAGENKHDINFRSEPMKGAEVRSMGVNSINQKLGVQVYTHILFVHAFLGCDTTSRVLGIGKAAGFKLIQENEELQEQA
uniref:Uncharacterized protein n=1 Tax=Octopus bimaculoides TaxID=37653 RepID=A0A0L8HWL4_OCTBM